MPPRSPSEQRLVSAARRRATAEDEWRQAIREAAEAGLSERAIAPLAGISHQRVHQILSEHSDGI